MLKQAQHDMAVRFWSFCHPEPGPELDSGIDFSISVFDLEFIFQNPAPWAWSFNFVQKKKGPASLAGPLRFGGADRDRTGGLQSAILALSQLSYCPVT